jgi:hypothetical protein
MADVLTTEKPIRIMTRVKVSNAGPDILDGVLG